MGLGDMAKTQAGTGNTSTEEKSEGRSLRMVAGGGVPELGCPSRHSEPIEGRF